jgi:hypothetical protein
MSRAGVDGGYRARLILSTESGSRGTVRMLGRQH